MSSLIECESIRVLRSKMNELVVSYPQESCKIINFMEGTAFFPAGQGLYKNTELTTNGIMVLGQDFDTVENYKDTIQKRIQSELKTPTWIQMLKLFEATQLPVEKCFFTNCLTGLRLNESAIGPSDLFKYVNYVNECKLFLKFQIEFQSPKLIICLGILPYNFLAAIFELNIVKTLKELDKKYLQLQTFNGITLIVLNHPSMYPLTVSVRQYKELKSHAAQMELIKDGLKKANL